MSSLALAAHHRQCPHLPKLPAELLPVRTAIGASENLTQVGHRKDQFRMIAVRAHAPGGAVQGSRQIHILPVRAVIARAQQAAGGSGWAVAIGEEEHAVAIGAGLGMLKFNSPEAATVAAAMGAGVNVIACGETMKALMLEKDDLFARLTLDEHEYSLYGQIRDALAIRAPTPDLVIYLQAPVNILLQRIRRRGINAEREIQFDYLERLNRTYTEFFHYYSDAPVLVVNAAEIDFAHNEAHFTALLQQALVMDGMRQYFNAQPTLL